MCATPPRTRLDSGHCGQQLVPGGQAMGIDSGLAVQPRKTFPATIPCGQAGLVQAFLLSKISPSLPF